MISTDWADRIQRDSGGEARGGQLCRGMGRKFTYLGRKGLRGGHISALLGEGQERLLGDGALWDGCGYDAQGANGGWGA